jgi:hypothetical protein
VRLVAEAGQQSLGALDQRARHPAEFFVRGVVDAVSASIVEQLGQRVLQQRQRAGSIGHLPDQGGHECRLERDAVGLRRTGDRTLQVVRRHRCDDLGPVSEQFTETSVLQGPVVEVGSQRGDDTDATLLVGDCTHQVGEEAVRGRRVDLRVQLLELIDQQE